jgi:arylsulfatase A-like enzyme
VLLVVIDTLRADALALDDPEGGGMPHLARRAGRAAAFTNASAASSWTLPSITSVLTGRLPSEHRITGEEGASKGLAEMATLAEVLGQGLGYETLAWVGQGWSQGPGSMFEGFGVVVTNSSFQAAPRMLQHWKQRRTSSRPWFLLLHTYEAHDPYGAANHPYPDLAPSPSEIERAVVGLGTAPTGATVTRHFVLNRAARVVIQRDTAKGGLHEAFTHYIWAGHRAAPDADLEDDLRTAYRQGVRWVDGLLEGVLSEFETGGLLRNTVVIVTGDHGEAFGEHGMLLHGRRLDDELLRVPLVVQGVPGIAPGTRVRGSVSLLDVVPTLLDVLALPPMEDLPGRSLLPALRGADVSRPAYAQVLRGPRHTAGERDDMLESVRSDAWKVVLTLDRRTGVVREEAFDLRTDPGERSNLAREGRAEGLAWDGDFCAAVERARDRLWTERAAIADLPAPGGAGGGTSTRAAPCTSAATGR